MSDDIRPNEIQIELPATTDAGIYFIGRIRTPWSDRSECPRRGDPDSGPICRLEIDPRWAQGLLGLESHSRVQVLYWMHQSRRDLIVQAPRRRPIIAGTFALRSPVRPNPIASSIVALVGIEEATVLVRGLDCIDGTPLVDLKPLPT